MLPPADVLLCWHGHEIMFSSERVSSVRQRKDELEQRMSTLQESRRELMVQLEQLMMLLKVLQMCFHLSECSEVYSFHHHCRYSVSCLVQ